MRAWADALVSSAMHSAEHAVELGLLPGGQRWSLVVPCAATADGSVDTTDVTYRIVVGLLLGTQEPKAILSSEAAESRAGGLLVHLAPHEARDLALVRTLDQTGQVTGQTEFYFPDFTTVLAAHADAEHVDMLEAFELYHLLTAVDGMDHDAAAVAAVRLES